MNTKLPRLLMAAIVAITLLGVSSAPHVFAAISCKDVPASVIDGGTCEVVDGTILITPKSTKATSTTKCNITGYKDLDQGETAEAGCIGVTEVNDPDNSTITIVAEVLKKGFTEHTNGDVAYNGWVYKTLTDAQAGACDLASNRAESSDFGGWAITVNGHPYDDNNPNACMSFFNSSANTAKGTDSSAAAANAAANGISTGNTNAASTKSTTGNQNSEAVQQKLVASHVWEQGFVTGGMPTEAVPDGHLFVAHGDIAGDGACHAGKWEPGQTVEFPVAGTWKLWDLSGGTAQDRENQAETIRENAARQTPCDWMDTQQLANLAS